MLRPPAGSGDKDALSIRDLRNVKETGTSKRLPSLLGLLPGTGENWPIADKRIPSNDPRNISAPVLSRFKSGEYAVDEWDQQIGFSFLPKSTAKLHLINHYQISGNWDEAKDS